MLLCVIYPLSEQSVLSSSDTGGQLQDDVNFVSFVTDTNRVVSKLIVSHKRLYFVVASFQSYDSSIVIRQQREGGTQKAAINIQCRNK